MSISSNTLFTFLSVTTVPSNCRPYRCYHHPLLQPSSAVDITDLESYAMASIDLIGAKLEAFETRMEDRLRALFVELRLGRWPSPRRLQHGGKRYFHYHKTLNASMVDIVVIHLGREAAQWYD
ncbi:hypothetical protein B296_00036616, partial [Ensete ventricosum]